MHLTADRRCEKAGVAGVAITLHLRQLAYRVAQNAIESFEAT